MENENEEMYITSDMASKVVKLVIRKAESDSDAPISVAILNPNGVVLAQKSMDRVTSGPSKLCVNKAYTCLQFGCDTIDLENLNPANFADPEISCFPGGTLLKGEKTKEDPYIMGAIGVSGRKSKQREGIQTLQDHELAVWGAKILGSLAHKDWVRRHNLRVTRNR